MNINNFLIVFIILFLITMIYFIINLFNQKLETFETEIISDFPIPNILNDNDVKIIATVSSISKEDFLLFLYSI